MKLTTLLQNLKNEPQKDKNKGKKRKRKSKKETLEAKKRKLLESLGIESTSLPILNPTENLENLKELDKQTMLEGNNDLKTEPLPLQTHQQIVSNLQSVPLQTLQQESNSLEIINHPEMILTDKTQTIEEKSSVEISAKTDPIPLTNVVINQTEIIQTQISETIVEGYETQNSILYDSIITTHENINKEEMVTDQYLYQMVSDQHQSQMVPDQNESLEQMIWTQAEIVSKLNFEDKNFIKNVKWSPDGSAIATNSEDHKLRIYHTPEQLSSASPFIFPAAEIIYDYCWYPQMTTTDMASCVLLYSSKDHPIHLLDSNNGKVRASYSGYNNVDALTSAISLTFDPSGEYIYAGYNKCVRMFNLDYPGRECDLYSTVRSKSNRAQTRQIPDGYELNGIISTIACSPDHSGLIACGSFNGLVGLYAENNFEPLTILDGHPGGVTQSLWSPCGNFLYTGGRKDNYILCWDIRNTQDVLFKISRTCTNNQRLFFDIDFNGRYLLTGSQTGEILFNDLCNNGKLAFSKQTSKASISCISCHPHKTSIFASGSGHRVIKTGYDDDEYTENKLELWKAN